MSSNAWKRAERQAARALGGRRNQRGGDFSQSLPDVEHERFSVEVKYRARLPYLLRAGLEQATHYDRNKVPLLVVKQKGMHGALAVLRLKDLTNLLDPVNREKQEETGEKAGANF